MNFTHIDHQGNAVMVDVSQKAFTARTASACGRIRMSRECYQAVESGTAKKGDVLGAAQIAGIMGAKQTADLIPLCLRLIPPASRASRCGSRLHRQVYRPDGSGDGSSDWSEYRASHHLRHVQGHR